MPLIFIVISRSPFLGKWGMQPFIYLFIMFWLYTAFQNRSRKYFLVFLTFGSILTRPVAFLLFIFGSTTSSSSWLNSPSLISSWLLILFVITLSLTLGEFSNRFLKCSFYFCIRSSWLVAFCFALGVHFHLLIWWIIKWFIKCFFFKSRNA